MRRSTSPAALRLMRLPGEGGPILRCSGELTVATVEALRRELTLILSLGYPAMILNLSGCSAVDADGLLAVLQTLQRLTEEGRRLAIVTGSGPVSRLFQRMRAPEELPLFATEASARAALDGGRAPHAAIPNGAAVRWLAETLRAVEAAPSPSEGRCESVA